MGKANPQIQVYLLSILVVAGVCLPLALIPLFGEITYDRIASITSNIIIVLAIIDPVQIYVGKSRTPSSRYWVSEYA